MLSPAASPWAGGNTGWRSSAGGSGNKRGGKAEERPVSVLTKQKGSGVASTFKKNR